MNIFSVISSIGWHELKNTVRDKRSLFFALIYGPIFLPMMTLGPIVFTSGKRLATFESVNTVHAVGMDHAPGLLSFLKSKNIDVEASEGDPSEGLRDQKYEAVLDIPKNYQDSLRAGTPITLTIYFANDRERSRDLQTQLRSVIEEYGRSIVGQRMLARGISSTLLLPVFVESIDVTNDELLLGVVSGLILMIVSLACILGPFYLAVDIVTGERERFSLEPLVSLPVPVYQLMLGKYLSVLIFCLGCGLVAAIHSFVWLRFLPDTLLGSATLPAAYTLLTVLIVVVPPILFFTSCLLLVSVVSKTVTEAQTQLSALLILAIAPLGVTQFLDVGGKPFVATFPVLGHYLQMEDLVFFPSTVSFGSLGSLSLVTVGAAMLVYGFSVYLFKKNRFLG